MSVPVPDSDARQRLAERAVEALWRGDAASRQLGMSIEVLRPGPRERDDAHPL